MGLKMRWDTILYRRTILNYILYPFSILFSTLLLLRRYFYSIGVFKVFEPSVPTISVGNIMSGGSGKTPFTIFLARLLRDRGYRIAVSHRGYKGVFEHTIRLISDRNGMLPEAVEAGDEPLLLAEKLPGTPIIVGRNRTKALQTLQRGFPDLDYIILDDSFQHLRVKKKIDLVLFNSLSKIGNGFVLPAGALREPLSTLRYADGIVYNGKGEIPGTIDRWGKKIIRVFYRVEKFYLSDGEMIEPSILKDKRVALVSGIGQPASFERTVREAGIDFQKHYRYPDHYDYNDIKVIGSIRSEVKQYYDYLLITEKDFTKLKRHSSGLPLVVVSIEVDSKETDQLIELIGSLSQ